MTKIGILTFHRSINYGSFLQSYSLANALRSHTEYEVEIIDYNMTAVELQYVLDIISRPIMQTYKNVIKYFKFKRTINANLPLSKGKLISNKIVNAARFMKDKYDVIIVGSDEVWKINKLRGFPNIYWLNEELNCIKVSYAASANRTRFDKLDDYHRKYIRDSLSKFSYIGARDDNTVNQLKTIDSKLIVKRNCDPTFLFDFKLTQNIKISLKDKLQKKYKLDLGKPIIGVMCIDDNVCRNIYDRYKDSYQVVSLFINTKYCDTYLYDLNPFEWAVIFSFLTITVTNFFHCTVFSILNNTPFISIDLEESSLLYESKIKDLLKRADLLENYVNLKNDSFSWEDVYSQIKKNINEPSINKMNSFVASEKKYFDGFVEELKSIINTANTRLEAVNE